MEGTESEKLFSKQAVLAFLGRTCFLAEKQYKEAAPAYEEIIKIEFRFIGSKHIMKYSTPAKKGSSEIIISLMFNGFGRLWTSPTRL